MAKLYSTTMINVGGREGHVEAPDGSMAMTITAPKPGKKKKEPILNNSLQPAIHPVLTAP